MHILITGHKGFIGTALFNRLSLRNDVVAVHGIDIKDGDANVISRYRTKNTYDLVYSSHCLEHMIDAKTALNEWWSLLKTGGYMILVLPDYDLYEQKIYRNELHKCP